MVVTITEPQEGLMQWLCERIGYVPTLSMTCIGQWDNDNEKLIGVVGYDGFSEVMVEMHSAGEPRRYWLTPQFLFLAFDIPFNAYGLTYLTSRVSTGNPRAVRFNEKLGFKEQCRIPKGAEDGDLIIFTMHRDECRYLKMHRFKEAA